MDQAHITTELNDSDYEEGSDSDSESFEDALEQMSLQCQAEKKDNEQREEKEEKRGGKEDSAGEKEESADHIEHPEEEISDATKDFDDDDESEEGVAKEEKDEGDIDEKELKERDEKLSSEEIEEFHKSALEIKLEANEIFKKGEYEAAIEKYTEALLTCPLCHSEDRSVLFSNRAACHMRMDNNEKSIKDCTKAVELKPTYVKALLRRAELYEKTEKLDEALEDYQRLLQLDPSLGVAHQACMRLPDQIKERNEKMKEEMLGKLKDLGNLVLRPFGLSTNNFNLQQDPNTGGYSVQFSQAPSNGK